MDLQPLLRFGETLNNLVEIFLVSVDEAVSSVGTTKLQNASIFQVRLVLKSLQYFLPKFSLFWKANLDSYCD